MNRTENLNLDILKEVSNIASGNAISALSEFIEKDLDIYIPSIERVHYSKVPTLLGYEENIIIGICQNVLEGFNGKILFTIDEDSFKKLIFSIFKKYNIGNYSTLEEIDTFNLSKLEMSVIQEIGNILTASYLNAISELLGKSIHPSSPSISIDMSSAILSQILICSDDSVDDILLTKTELILDDYNLNSQVILIPDNQELVKLINSIKERYNIYD